MKNQIIQGDCLEIMPNIPDKSIDMILCDLPYGTTACKWDTIIPFEHLWKQYERIIKDNGAIVLTASQPFTSILVMSNLKMFKYEWIWLKDKPSNFMLAKKQPLKYHENILIFYKNQPMYNPNMEIRLEKDKRKNKSRLNKNNICNTKLYCKESKGNDDYIYPKSYQKFNKERGKNEHPTQKPVALFEYLIRTYTNEGDLVLDNCAGSGTTGVACKNLGRKFILIEKEKKYIEIINKRIKAIPELLLV